jgi:hypothetical protein
VDDDSTLNDVSLLKCLIVSFIWMSCVHLLATSIVLLTRRALAANTRLQFIPYPRARDDEHGCDGQVLYIHMGLSSLVSDVDACSFREVQVSRNARSSRSDGVFCPTHDRVAGANK